MGIANFGKFPWYQFEPLYGVFRTQGVRWWRRIFRHVTPSRDFWARNPKSEWLVFHYNHNRFGAIIMLRAYQWLLKVTWGHLGSFGVIQGHLFNFKMFLKLFKTHWIAPRLAKWMTSSDPKWPQVTSYDPMWPLVTSRDLLAKNQKNWFLALSLQEP